MSWQKIYREKLRSPEEAILENVHSGEGIYGGGISLANTCLNAMFRLIDQGKLTAITMYVHSPCNPGLELERYQFTEEQLRFPSWFMNAPDREYVRRGQCKYVPLQYGMLERYINKMHPETCVLMMSPPDEDGYCNIGPNGYHIPALAQCKRIVAQVSKYVPYVCGTAHRYHVSQFDAIVEADDLIATITNPTATEVESKISQHILEYIPDGACIQLGIGGIANAVGYGLRSKKHLGVHTEVLTESIVDLMENGIIDNSRKSVFPGVSAVGFVFGSQRQYDYINHNPKFLFASFTDIVNIANIAANDNMISINAAVSVDLTGQVCAESIGHRQYSGTGGQLDFVRGASMSKGGGSFIALPSTVQTKEGRKSRIVLNLEPGSIITTPRTDVQYIASEYGCVNLQFCDVPDRVRKMISIAHPEYRDELMFRAKKLGLVY